MNKYVSTITNRNLLKVNFYANTTQVLKHPNSLAYSYGTDFLSMLSRKDKIDSTVILLLHAKPVTLVKNKLYLVLQINKKYLSSWQKLIEVYKFNTKVLSKKSFMQNKFFLFLKLNQLFNTCTNIIPTTHCMYKKERMIE